MAAAGGAQRPPARDPNQRGLSQTHLYSITPPAGEVRRKTGGAVRHYSMRFGEGVSARAVAVRARRVSGGSAPRADDARMPTIGAGRT
jgi:hypothetical protein